MDKILKNITENAEGCWIWNKSVTSAGYGQLTIKGKYWSAHRYSYTMVFGEIPDGMIIRHSCHNTRCCNPDHLTVGTALDNWRDSECVHKEAALKRRGKWCVDGVDYGTCRNIVNVLGISMMSVIKYTKDGVFDIEDYRRGCKVANVIPKI